MKLHDLDLQALIATESFEVGAVCGAELAFDFIEDGLWAAIEREGYRRRGKKGYDEALAAFEAIAAMPIPRLKILNAAASLAVMYGVAAEGFTLENRPARADFENAYTVVKAELPALLPEA